MSASLSYPRTDGFDLLPGTWAYVKKLSALADLEMLPADERYSYFFESREKREEFTRLAQLAQTEPPTFLRFLLTPSPDDSPLHYPGACDASQGLVGDGVLVGHSESEAARLLGISPELLQIQCGKFSGSIFLDKLLPGTSLYRTVGLTAANVQRGSVTNVVLGDFWDRRSPNTYRNVAEWRAKTAVMAEWNGDYGHIRVTLAREVCALVGIVGMQKIARSGNAVLPGGGHQVYIPTLSDADLVEPVSGRALHTIIVETVFSGTAPTSSRP